MEKWAIRYGGYAADIRRTYVIEKNPGSQGLRTDYYKKRRDYKKLVKSKKDKFIYDLSQDGRTLPPEIKSTGADLKS